MKRSLGRKLENKGAFSELNVSSVICWCNMSGSQTYCIDLHDRASPFAGAETAAIPKGDAGRYRDTQPAML